MAGPGIHPHRHRRHQVQYRGRRDLRQGQAAGRAGHRRGQRHHPGGGYQRRSHRGGRGSGRPAAPLRQAGGGGGEQGRRFRQPGKDAAPLRFLFAGGRGPDPCLRHAFPEHRRSAGRRHQLSASGRRGRGRRRRGASGPDRPAQRGQKLAGQPSAGPGAGHRLRHPRHHPGRHRHALYGHLGPGVQHHRHRRHPQEAGHRG